jgi:hypothetical protein
MGLQDTKDLVTRNKSHLGNTVRVTKGNTDLRGSKTLASQLGNVFNNVFGSGLKPRRGRAAVGEGGGRCYSIMRQKGSSKNTGLNVQMPFPGACIRPMLALSRAISPCYLQITAFATRLTDF